MKTSEQLYADAFANVIELQHGVFSIDAPTFDIRDIAHNLANKCRFNGAPRDFYSVAEHSLLVSQIVERMGYDPREGLLHDASEAYGPDVASPQKPRFPDLLAFENTVDGLIRKKFELPAAKSDGCKLADVYALLIEANELRPSRGEGPLWASLARFRGPALQFARDHGFSVRGFTPARARARFLLRWDSLR